METMIYYIVANAIFVVVSSAIVLPLEYYLDRKERRALAV